MGPIWIHTAPYGVGVCIVSSQGLDRVQKNKYTVSGLNGVAVARHGLKLWENGATACNILMDTFLDQNPKIQISSDQKSRKKVKKFQHPVNNI